MFLIFQLKILLLTNSPLSVKVQIWIKKNNKIFQNKKRLPSKRKQKIIMNSIWKITKKREPMMNFITMISMFLISSLNQMLKQWNPKENLSKKTSSKKQIWTSILIKNQLVQISNNFTNLTKFNWEKMKKSTQKNNSCKKKIFLIKQMTLFQLVNLHFKIRIGI